MKLKPVALAILAATLSQPSWAQDTVLDKIYVSDGHFIDDELSTPYSTRQFNREDIRKSGATSLTEFLSQNTSILIKSSFGNPLIPRIDLGGFGETGFENVQIILNGVSLKNIDLVPTQLSAIDLNSIQNISIIKGSGSVLYGNGSAGGAIVINTFGGANTESGGKFSTKYTSDYRQAQSVAIQHSETHGQYKFFGDFALQTEQSDGQIVVKADGTKNTLAANNLTTGFGVTNGKTTADVQFTANRSELYYIDNLSLSDFEDDPYQDQATFTPMQDIDQKTSQLHFGHKFDKTKADYTWKTVNKDSELYSLYNYDQNIHHLDFKTRLQNMVISYGLKADNNQRVEEDKKFVIDTTAYYASANFHPSKNLTFNAGLRFEDVQYEYSDSGNNLDKKENLNAYNLGVNYKLNDQSAIYANFNHAFNSPAIDRYFSWNGTFTSQVFNGFIDVQTSDTLTVGYKNRMQNTDITVEAFASKLKDELFLDKYLNPFGLNTTLDRTSKQGINLLVQQYFDQAKVGADYQYQNTRIDRNDDTDLKGKKVPGVPEHTINLFAEASYTASWMPALKQHRINVSHKAATESYALSDFKNEYGKHPTNHSTDLTYSMENKQLSVKLGVNNLFNRPNGSYVYSATAPGIFVYPELLERSWFIQADLKL